MARGSSRPLLPSGFVIRPRPDMAEAHFDLALAYARLGRGRDMTKEFCQAFDLAPQLLFFLGNTSGDQMDQSLTNSRSRANTSRTSPTLRSLKFSTAIPHSYPCGTSRTSSLNRRREPIGPSWIVT
jgi:hypothetical protein